MKKERKSPTILKPVIDEETALQFAMAGSEQTPEPPTATLPKTLLSRAATQKSSHDKVEKGMREISLKIGKDLYDRIAKDAARKNRTIEEQLKKHLTKHYEK
jgi:hypothetical protein